MTENILFSPFPEEISKQSVKQQSVVRSEWAIKMEWKKHQNREMEASTVKPLNFVMDLILGYKQEMYLQNWHLVVYIYKT